MLYLIIKGALTGALVIGVAEIAKRSSLLPAVLASLPLTSILAMIWIYIETQNTHTVKHFSFGIFWMIFPSLVFFLIFPVFLNLGLRFYSALLASCGLMIVVYTIYLQILRSVGIEL